MSEKLPALIPELTKIIDCVFSGDVVSEKLPALIPELTGHINFC
eukprot:COSAG02_NODE_933_length_15812_cov_68.551709_8_plen_44_part_00